MPSNPFTDPQWATHTVDAIDRVVGVIRRYTTRPLVVVARGLVFGVLAIAVGLIILVLLLIGGTRALQSLGDVWLRHDTSVWVSYLVLGTIFALVGALFMRRRTPPQQ